MRDYNFCVEDVIQYGNSHYDVIKATYKYIIIKSPFKELKITKKSEFAKIKLIRKGEL